MGDYHQPSKCGEPKGRPPTIAEESTRGVTPSDQPVTLLSPEGLTQIGRPAVRTDLHREFSFTLEVTT